MVIMTSYVSLSFEKVAWIKQCLEHKLENKSFPVFSFKENIEKNPFSILSQKFNLSNFEQNILLLCVGMAIDPTGAVSGFSILALYINAPKIGFHLIVHQCKIRLYITSLIESFITQVWDYRPRLIIPSKK